MYKICKPFAKVLLACLLIQNAFASSDLLSKLNEGEKTFQLGVFRAKQGKAQEVYIQDLIGDYFSLSHHHDQNGLIGLGYFLPGNEYSHLNLSFGINAFYFFKTQISGDVSQENLFTNLSYDYKITNTPIYLAAKALLGSDNDPFNTVLDVGIGPNIIQSSHFTETSLDGITIPDHAFTSTTNTAFSAMGGIGFRVNHLFEQTALECGYRFFYLGQGKLHSKNNQILNDLKTGNSYAQAIVCGIVF